MTERLQHKPYTDPRSGEVVPMSPDDFGTTYSKYYQSENNDSPDQSRRHLIERLIIGIETLISEKRADDAKITILDIGAGRQILENELQHHPRFSTIAEYVSIFTLDIANISAYQLLAKNTAHVTADGSQLPFANRSFDIVYSSMAIDFMPKQAAFGEVRRVLKENGKMFVNFHHPDLAESELRNLSTLYQKRRDQINTLEQIRRHGQKSSKFVQRIAKHQSDLQETRDLIYSIETFFGQIFPELIFHTTDDIINFLQSQFPQAWISVEEFTNLKGINGWFTADIHFDQQNGSEETEAA
jgi:ubiquinone/menaquinone biosynthesis C-methylase UbiE